MPDLLASLLAHTGSLHVGPGVPRTELDDLRRALVSCLQSGQASEDIGSAVVLRPFPEAAREDLRHFCAVAPSSPVTTRIARRDSEVRNAGLPDWAHGMAPSR